MKYSEVLHDYQPSETGDFMLRYEINEGEYIIYSPERGKASCMELKSFRDITPFQLAILLGREVAGTEEPAEFSLEQPCSREQLLTYLFDVETSVSGKQKRKRRVSGTEGYFLHGLKNPQKIVNFFQFDASGNESLVFYDKVGFAVSGDENDTAHINVTWSPFQFSLLEEGINSRSYLLASSDPMLLNFVSPKVSGRKICLYSKRNPLEALLFVEYFVKSLPDQDKPFILHMSGSEELLLSLEGWNPVTVVRFVSRMNKAANLIWKAALAGEDSDEAVIFRLQSVGGVSYVLFPNQSVTIRVFLESYISEAGLETVFSLC